MSLITSVKQFDRSQFSGYISRVALSMEAVAIVPGIHASMQNKNLYSKVIVNATNLDGLLTIIVSVIGFLAYGA